GRHTEVDGLSGFVHPGHVVEITWGAATGGDNGWMCQWEALEYAAFQCPEGGFAMLRKIFGDGHACFVDDFFIEVDKRALCFECEFAAPRGFTTSHEADEEYGLGISHLDKLF